MEFPKYIGELHYISVFGIILIGIGTILLHRGNALKGKEVNSGLNIKIDTQKRLIDSLKGQNDTQINQNTELKTLNNRQITDLENQSNLISNLQNENQDLISIVERLRYPIPDKFFVTLTIDFQIEDNDF